MQNHKAKRKTFRDLQHAETQTEAGIRVKFKNQSAKCKILVFASAHNFYKNCYHEAIL